MNKEYVIEKLAAFSDKRLLEETAKLLRAMKESKEVMITPKMLAAVKSAPIEKVKTSPKVKEYLYSENYFPNPTLGLKQVSRFR